MRRRRASGRGDRYTWSHGALPADERERETFLTDCAATLLSKIT